MHVTLDFETYYDSKHNLTKLNTMSYVKAKEFHVHGVGIKIDDGETQWYNSEETEDALREIDWSNSTLIAHNTPFDGYILTRYYGLTPAYYADTKALAKATWPGRGSSLKEVAMRMWPDDEKLRKGDALEKTKGILDLSPDLEEELGEYCIQDVELTYMVYRTLSTAVIDDEHDLIDMTCRMFCEPKLIANLEMLTKHRDSEIARSKGLIEASGYDAKILSSNKQFAELVESLGLTVPTKTSPTTGKPIPAFGKADKGYLELKKANPNYDHIWAARGAAKSRISETRAQRFIDARNPDGTISMPIGYYNAHTGRFGGAEKLNVQNMPRNSPLRLALEAPEGKLVFVADLSAIEARVLAWLAGELELLEQFRANKCVYSIFAKNIYNRTINKYDDPTERFVGKVAVLGLGFGMGHATFDRTLETGVMGPPLKLPTHQAQKIVNTYRSTYPNIPLLWRRMEEKLASTMNAGYFEKWRCLTFTDRSVYLPNKLALKYHNLTIDSMSGQLTYEARKKEYTWGGSIVENIVQALARIIITDGMLRIQRDPTLIGDIVLTVHDEIIFLGSEQDPHATMEKLISHMCTPPSWAPDLPLAAEGGFDKGYSK